MAKILLVEDDAALRDILQGQLVSRGHTVLTALNGKEGLQAIIQEKPDLVVADVIMPEMSGFEMTEQIRGLEEVKNTPVVMVTALSQAEDRAKASALGITDYIVKNEGTPADFVKIIEDKLVKLQSSTPTPTSSPGIDSEPPQL